MEQGAWDDEGNEEEEEREEGETDGEGQDKGLGEDGRGGEGGKEGTFPLLDNMISREGEEEEESGKGEEGKTVDGDGLPWVDGGTKGIRGRIISGRKGGGGGEGGLRDG